MSDTVCTYQRRDEALVAYLYEDLESDERRLFAAHLKTCPVCRTELDDLLGVRADLAQWKPPDPARVLTFAPMSPPQPSRWSSLGGIPAWAQAAAALLVLGVALAIANLQVRVDDEGVTVSTGWTAQPAAVTPASASVTATPEQPPAEAPWRADLAALETALRAELQNAPARAAFAPAATANVDAEAVLREVRSLIATSESNQETELALRIGNLARDFQVQRNADLQRIQRTFTVLESTTGGEIVKQRQLLNNLASWASQRQ